MKVFILINERVDEFENDTTIHVFSTKEKAIAEMEETIKSFMEYDELAQYENCIIERDDNAFRAHEEGFWFSNRFCVYIEERPVL